jgi:FixJ family two-component response regulator
VAHVVRSAGYTPEVFDSLRRFLARRKSNHPACLVVDLHMPEGSALELQQALRRKGDPLPVIFLSGRGDVRATVTAMKAGAVDLLTKPLDARELLDAMSRALESDSRARAQAAEREALRARFAILTPREQQVCDLVAAGWLNKQIAAELGAGEKTIKVHRGRVMRKLGVDSVAALVRLVDRRCAA